MVLAILVALVGVTILLPTVQAQKLRPYLIEPNSISVSGVSSGAAMAIQLHVAYSQTFIGMGAIAGGPYFCAMDNPVLAVTCMVTPSLISIESLWAATEAFALTGQIDRTANINSSRVWLFTGKKDLVVNSEVMVKARQFYEGYMPNSSIQWIANISAEHAWITDFYGNACDYLGPDFINNCNYDAAGAMLRHFYWRHKFAPRARTYNASNIFAFDQGYYTPLQVPPWSISMGRLGFLYVPTACQSGTVACKLHFCMTGCLGFYDLVGKILVENSGFNQWAETNNIIIVYPQTTFSAVNPEGCWDWVGYTGPTYATQLGPQMITIKNMINALTGH